ncbi:MAG: SAM-dependent methyltransferase [Chitinivibrionales bacterium]|nr:SAM-dependent methyltransferase [Chitinivibrionales bacterium]
MTFSLSIAASLALLFAAILISVTISTVRCNISPSPSNPRSIRYICTMLSKYRTQGVVYDTGSGWGTLACAIARKAPDMRVVGYEISLFPYLFSLLLKRILRVGNVTFMRKDFFAEDLSPADGIVCFLYTKAMARLKEKIERECRPGTLVISNTFAFPGWREREKVVVADLFRTPILVYVAGS